jgi:Ca-activated chloride channel homolog
MRILEFLPAWFALILLVFPARCVAQSPPTSSSSGTLRLIAIGGNGEPVTNLKPEDLRLFINKQARKILSVSSTASLPKTIGIFIGGYRPGQLPNKVIAAIQGFLNSVWQDQDVGFVVSISDKIYKDVPSTSDLTQIENALSKILAVNHDRQSYYLSDWTATFPAPWYGAVSSAPLSPKDAGSAEKVYVVLSGFWSYDSAKSGINAVLSQQARIFPLLFDPNPQGGAECVYNVDGPCYLGYWKAEHTAKNIAKETGGDEFTLERKRDLIRAQARLTNELRSTYMVTYEALPRSVSTGKIEILCRLSNVRLLYARE